MQRSKDLQAIEKLNEKLEKAINKLRLSYCNQRNPGASSTAIHAINIIEAGLFELYKPMTVTEKLVALRELVHTSRRLDSKNLSEVCNDIEKLVIKPLKELEPLLGDSKHFQTYTPRPRTAPSQNEIPLVTVSQNPVSFMKAQPIKENKFKIFLLGARNAGTSSLFTVLQKKSFTETFPNSNIIDRTIISDSVALENKKEVPVKLELWDIPFYNNPEVKTHPMRAKVYILVCDLTNKESFNKIYEMKKFMDDRNHNNSIFYIIGTKSDLSKQVVTKNDLSNMAKELNCDYRIVSSKTGTGIDELKKDILQKILPNAYEIELSVGIKQGP